MTKDWEKGVVILKNDGVVILPTDTIYGIVGSALSKKAVDRIYKIKKRNKQKPFIVLINSFKDLKIFKIAIGKDQAKILEKFWPEKVSIILPCANKKFKYLHRGNQKIAFRRIYPRNKNLFDLIQKVGPLVAPSANPEGSKSASNIKEARNYFNENVDLYINGGIKKSKPSTLIEYFNGKIIKLR